jgi:hypothetical protein
MSLHLAKPEHEVLYRDLCALLNKHADKVTSRELLAVAANMLGKLLALQDQREMTTDLAMQIVLKNIEHGNKQVIEQLSKTKGNA